MSVFVLERATLSSSGGSICASCVCTCMYVCHMPHITEAFYLSLYVRGYNSTTMAMQLSALAFAEQSHILQLWHDATRRLYLLMYQPKPLL